MADKTERIRIFEETMTLCDQNERLAESIRRSIAGQSITWQEDAIPAPKGRFSAPAALALSPDRTYEAAQKYCAQGKKVCVLNFASSVTPGGGVTRGCSAQEESLCRISTLYPAINDASVRTFYDRHRQMIDREEMHYENRDDCIFTPGVAVIREDTFDCELLPESDWYTVDVITCAAPDLRYAPVERSLMPTEDLTALFEHRWERILSVAARENADVLILGAFGCGAFRNSPKIVAQAFSRVYEAYQYCFETIEFAVYTQSYEGLNYIEFSKLDGIRELKPGFIENQTKAPAADRETETEEVPTKRRKLFRLKDLFK